MERDILKQFNAYCHALPVSLVLTRIAELLGPWPTVTATTTHSYSWYGRKSVTTSCVDEVENWRTRPLPVSVTLTLYSLIMPW